MYQHYKQCHKTHLLLEAEEKIVLNYIINEVTIEEFHKIPWSKLQDIQVRLRAKTKKINMEIPKPDRGIAVDAWCRNNGSIHAPCGYRGIDIATGQILFSNNNLGHGTSNIAEFLAIVHGLMFARKTRQYNRIYSDSEIAISWVKSNSCGTRLKAGENNELANKIWRAEKWLSGETKLYDVDKWFTDAWGENPADYGNKNIKI